VGLGKVKTRIIMAYNPCEPGKNANGTTVFEQHERYFDQKGVFTSPRTLFYDQLTDQLLIWERGGEELFLSGDFNKNVYTGRFGKTLAEGDILMTEQCLQTTWENFLQLTSEGKEYNQRMICD